jgi:secreted Zn-dependent insulinase-like peptidase
MISQIEEKFPFSSLNSKLRSTKKVVIYPKVKSPEYLGYRISRQEPNPNDDNSAVTFYFQLPSLSPSDYLFVELLSEVIEQPFYDSLRTKQQLGYIVYSGIKVRGNGIRYLTLTAQSSIVSGDRITQLIENFVSKEIPLIVKSLSEKQFRTFINSICTKKLEPDQRLSQQAERFWTEIILSSDNDSSIPLFDRSVVETDLLRKLSKKDFELFVSNFFSIQNRRLLVSQITSSLSPMVNSSITSTSFIEIKDEKDFRESQQYFNS